MQISYRFGFDAAHHFPDYPAGHPYHGVHGHSFQAEVAIRGTPDPATGFIADLGQVERACLEARAQLDHKVLNEIDGLARPSLENLCLWLWKRLSPAFSGLARVTIRRDSCGQACTYEGPN
jgi:6-pyruvoyltetrahydropterin/6-carboxytetrahydropterin synthase